MATFDKFEDIILWKEARELNKVMGEMIEQKRFKNNYRLINQIEGSAGSIMDNIAEGLKEVEIKNSSSFFSSQKHPAVN